MASTEVTTNRKASLRSTGHGHTNMTDRCSCKHSYAYSSPQGYAWEITTPEGGWGLDGVLQGVQHKLDGIANGIDTTEWSPETDGHLPAPYSAADMSGSFQGVSRAPLSRFAHCGRRGPPSGVCLRKGSRSALPRMCTALPAGSDAKPARLQARRSARRPCSGSWGCRRTLESRCWASSGAWTSRRCAAVNLELTN